MKVICRRIFAFILALALTFCAVFVRPVYALDVTKILSSRDKLKIFAQNGIFFSTDCVNEPYVTSPAGTIGTVDATDNAARIWNYFVTANIPGLSNNAAAIAGIMGNLQQESSLDPFQASEGGFYGLYQVGSSIDPAFILFMQDKNLNNYWQSTSVPENIVIAALSAELDYLTKYSPRFISGSTTLNGASVTSVEYSFLNNLSSVTTQNPENYSDLFLVTFEGAVTDSSVSPHTNSSNEILDSAALAIGTRYFSAAPGGGRYYQEAEERRKHARAFYERFARSSSSTIISAATGNGNNIPVNNGSWPSLLDPEGLRIPFVEAHHDTAVQLSLEYGIPWETVIAQGIVESASGTSKIARDKNNYFGISAYDDSPYESAQTYASELDGWRGYYDHIVNTATYVQHGVFQGVNITDPIEYVKTLKAAGYATDPNYVSTLSGVITSIQNYAKAKGWPSSAEIAAGNPQWFANAEAKRVLAEAGGGSSSSVASSTVNAANLFKWDQGWVSGIPGLTKHDASQDNLSETPMNYSAGGPNKILLHYTQGTSNGIEAFPIGSRFPAHFIVDLVKKEGFQLLSVDRGSVASVSADNTTVQIEIVGFGHSSEAGYTPEYDLQKFGNAEWDYLAILINAIASQYHIPTTTPVSWEGANVRVKSQSEFDKMTGIVGHMHAPGDDHGDPGNIWPQVSAALARNPIANTTGINLVDTCRVSTLYGTNGLIATTPTTAGENLTQDQIEAIINYYKTQADAEASAGKWMMPIQDSGIWNCFSLSAWWIQTLTTIGRADVTQWGSGGKDLAHAVAQIYHLEESNTPRPYAVFSVGRTQDAPGHTGIVVAVDGDEVTFIEASYGDEGYTDKRTESLSSGYFNNIVSPYAFTYLDSVMDINALNAVLGASASTAGKSS